MSRFGKGGTRATSKPSSSRCARQKLLDAIGLGPAAKLHHRLACVAYAWVTLLWFVRLLQRWTSENASKGKAKKKARDQDRRAARSSKQEDASW